MHGNERLPQLNPARANVLGVGVHAIDLAQAVAILEAAVESGRKGYVCVTGVHGVMEAQKDGSLRSIINRALLVTPDGMPTVWVGKLQGHRHMSRVFGPELMLKLAASSVRSARRHFLCGGGVGVAEELRQNLLRWFPGIQIVGTFAPPFRPLTFEEEEDFEKMVAAAKPDIMWVGLSTPKQERFMAKYLHRLDTKLMIGVGAAFDFHTGRIADSPEWVKDSGFQWLHRLCQEPSRLWKRYLMNNPLFVCKILLQLSGIRRYYVLSSDDSGVANAAD